MLKQAVLNPVTTVTTDFVKSPAASPASALGSGVPISIPSD